MGKKSRKGKPKAGRKGGGVPRAPAVDALAPLGTTVPPPERADEKKPPPGAACWICLDGDPDDGGKPIVRDCSCRGDDAGYAHLSCLIKYAEGKTKDIVEADQPDGQNPNEPWRTCPNCRREYQRHVAIDMAKAQISFVDEILPPGVSEIAKLSALHAIAIAVTTLDYAGNPDLMEEGKRAATEMVTIIQRSGRVGEEGYISGKLMSAYVVLGKLAEAEGTEAGDKMALEYYCKLQKLNESLGDGATMRGVEFAIDRLKSRRDGRKVGPPSEQALDDVRHDYATSVKTLGEDESLDDGVTLITALVSSGGNSWECERLAAKLHSISRRVHGPEHDLTVRIEKALRKSRVRRLAKGAVDGPAFYQVLQVNDDERKYIVKSVRCCCGTTCSCGLGGPAKSSAPCVGVVSEIAFEDDYRIMPGTPVVCHGLKKAQHLNGKLGDVRSLDLATGRYVVRFEDKALKKASVRLVNLRIVIDLPDESTCS